MRRTLAAPAVDTSFGLLAAAIVASAFAFAIFGTPPLPPAPMLMLGVASPLTGMTRSFVALAEGRITDAFVLHPLGPFLFAACIVAVVSLAVRSRTGRRPAFVDGLVRRIVRVPHAGLVVAAAFLLVWIRQIAVFG